MTDSQAGARIIRFSGARRGPSPARDQKALMDAVYTTGTLPVAADDLATKRMAARLQILGFFGIEEIGEGGALRRLLPSESVRAETGRPWRLSRPRRGAEAGLEKISRAL